VRVGPASECIYLEWKSSLGVGQLGGDSHLRLVSYVSEKWPVIWPMAIRRGCSGGAGGGEGGGGGGGRGRGGALQFTHVWEFGRTVPDQSKLVPRRLICSVVVVVVTKKFNSKANFLGPDRVAGRIRCVVRCMSTSTSHVPCSMSHGPCLGFMATRSGRSCTRTQQSIVERCVWGTAFETGWQRSKPRPPKNLRQTHSMHWQKNKIVLIKMLEFKSLCHMKNTYLNNLYIYKIVMMLMIL